MEVLTETNPMDVPLRQGQDRNKNCHLTTYQRNIMGQIETITDPHNQIKSQGLAPTVQVDYLIDLTRSYHNLLQKTEAGNTQRFLWDGAVIGMEQEGMEGRQYFFQDELGSPIRLANEAGEETAVYGYDEFGQSIYEEGKAIQPFGYTEYQKDGVAQTYFAQAREYAPEQGRFVSEDRVKGFAVSPITMNAYTYCFNTPMVLVDLDGLFPSLADVKKGIGKFYDKHKDAIKTVAVFTLIAVSVAVVAVAVVASGGTLGVAMVAAAPSLAAAGVGSLVFAGAGSATNALNGEDWKNGFIGGWVNGAISGGGGTALKAPKIANAVGGTVGNEITENMNNSDHPVAERKSKFEIHRNSLFVGAMQGIFCGSLDKLGNSAGISFLKKGGLAKFGSLYWELNKTDYGLIPGFFIPKTIEVIEGSKDRSNDKIKKLEECLE